MPQMTHSDMATHHELQLKKKFNSPALFVNEIHMSKKNEILSECPLKIFQVKSNRTSRGPKLLKLHQFIYIIALYHQKVVGCCETKLKNRSKTIKGVGGAGGV